MFDFSSTKFTKQIEAWLEEDLATGDITSMSVVPIEHQAHAVIHAKQNGIVAGLPLAVQVFRVVDEHLALKMMKEDGDVIKKGEVLLEIQGNTRSILAAERLALNLLQRLSGIASLTNEFMKELSGLPTRLVDTRKTTPGLRILEKYAVSVGGGHNHRFGLFDAVMIKDNHIKAAGSIARAIEQARHNIPHTMKIEVEIERLEQLDEAMAADIIMLDNMPVEMMTAAVKKIREIRPHIIIEASGNVSRHTLRNIALTGVDVISAGSLTHSVHALDISLDLYAQKASSLKENGS